MSIQSVARRVLNLKTVAVAALAVGAGLAQAASLLDFELLNSTNQPIVSIWATPSGNPDWGRPFSNTFVPEGGGQRVNFTDASSCYYDLRVKFSEGQLRYWRNVNLCSVNRFRVYVQDGAVKGFTS